MKDYFSIEMENCVKNFQNLLRKDAYISKKEYDNYLEEYKEVFELILKNSYPGDDNYQEIIRINQEGSKLIDAHNDQFVIRKLIEEKDYFDNMFKEIDPSIVLDEEQRRAILIDEDYSLIVAGAGSGKTTTMAAKVKYLIDKKKVNKNKIILLAFTNKAALELDRRINEDFELEVPVLTFHKLGMQFIRTIFSEENQPVRPIGEEEKIGIFCECFEKRIFHNKQFLKELVESFPSHFHFQEDYLNYDTYDEYYQHHMEKKIESLNNNFTEEIKDRVSRRLNKFRSINGDVLKSKGEAQIANYLYEHSIPYEYEKNYPWKINSRTYQPDFTITDDERTLYIEYYGMATLKKDGTIFSYDKDYQKQIIQKRELHKKHNTVLIELFGRYEDAEKNYQKELTKSLNENRIYKEKRSEEQILKRLLETSRVGCYYDFIKFMISFISRFKENNFKETDFPELIQKTEDIKLREQIDHAEKFYKFYQHYIHSRYLIDFQDMINYSTMGVEIVKEKKQRLNYDYIIIDEYQDISRQRYHFAKRISDLFDSKIVAVGDDWQSIYSFSGSDVDLFTHFYYLMGYAEIIQITNTYRNSQELIDIAGEFISQDTESFIKNLKSNKHLTNPVEVHYYGETISELNRGFKTKEELVIELLKSIEKRKANSKVLLLGRYNEDLDELIESGRFSRKRWSEESEDSLTCHELPKLNIDFLTVHKSKGMGYDEVILLNALDAVKGFPSQIEDEPLIRILYDEKPRGINYSEERRLFYVALTRTKNHIYILCPSREDRKSEFIKEILEYHQVKEIKHKTKNPNNEEIEILS